MAESGEMRAWPQRLHHERPSWVKAGAVFHVRLRVDVTQARSLVEPELAKSLLAAAQNYHERQEWHCLLFLVMPDHLHALLAFPEDKGMVRVVGSWKRFAARSLGVRWQTNFFDHRIRGERDLAETWEYVLQNPAVKGLCAAESPWPWVWHGD